MKRGFVDKLIARLGRLRPEEAQAHVLRIVREKGFLETIFNAIQEGIIVTDPNGRIAYLNTAAAQLFGLNHDTALGQPLDSAVRGLDWASLANADGGRDKFVSRDMEVFYPANRFLNFYVVPLLLEETPRAARRRGGRPDEAARVERAGHAMIVRDLTESRRNAQETLETERLNALTLLAAGVAHEIGNPLNSLNIHLQLMERKLRKLPLGDRAELEDSVRIAKDEIRRLDFIVSQFLRAIRPASLQTQIEDVNAVVRESVAFLQAEIEDRDILVETELAENLPPLEIDRDQLKQAFYNVIKNAVQAMQSGGILRITSGAEPEYVCVAFTDTGGGISQEHLNKVFEPYFTTKASGSGLGLLIVRRIVRAHGGEIELRSDEGRGLTITIRLPRRDRQVRMLALREGDNEASGEDEG
ncbi:MAG: PAS domain-containing protein [Verrucomicrobia bacterium]|nr:PAS domain-containing protein [Verrucomicrobiota bacterium]